MSLKLDPINVSVEDLSREDLFYGTQLQIVREYGPSVRIFSLAKLVPKADFVVFLFPSAQPTAEPRVNPIYHRWTWAYNLSNAHTFAISDPALNLSDLHANWFQSNIEVDNFFSIACFIKEVIKHLSMDESKVILYGSSMGGFGALMAGAHLPASLVIAEVPQIDLRMYKIKSALKLLEDRHFGGQSIYEYHEKNKEKINVLDRYIKFSNVPSIQIITNSLDPAHSEHENFISAINQDLKKYESVGDLTVTCRSDNIGHRPLPTSIAINYIKQAMLLGWKHRIEAGRSWLLPDTDSNGAGAESDYKSTLAAAIDAANQIKFTKTREDLSVFLKAKEFLLKAAHVNKSADWPLLKFCSITKLWTNSFNGEILEASTEAFNRRQTLEAFIYFCRACLYNLSNEEALKEIESMTSRCTDAQVANTSNIFIGIYLYDQGDFKGYESSINRFIKNKAKEFNAHLSIPASTVITDTEKINTYEESYVPRILGVEARFFDRSRGDEAYAISTSCDRKYLKIYGEYLVKSFEITCHKEGFLHIGVTSGDQEEYDHLLKAWGAKNTWISVLNISSEENEAPIASALRFSLLHQILLSKKIPVFVFDLDAVIKYPLRELVEKYKGGDVCSRILKKGMAPWEKYTGGFSLFYPTDPALMVSQAIARAIELCATDKTSQWWIDQNCFEAGIRAYKKNHQQCLNIIDFSSERDNVCTMPVGNKDAKLYALNKSLSILMGSLRDTDSPIRSDQ